MAAGLGRNSPDNSMPTQTDFDEAKARAKKTIQTTWQDVAQAYTLGWGGPIDVVERSFPFIGSAILNIRSQVSTDLPILFFQSRESPPKDMIAAVPYLKDTGNPYNSRLASVRTLSPEEAGLYSGFAQAFWFSIHMKLLPDPKDDKVFHDAILAWTGEKLFKI